MTPVSQPSGGRIGPRAGLVLLGALCPVVALLALGIGRYDIPLRTAIAILAAQVAPIEPWWSEIEQHLILLGRLPRVLLAALVGGGLGVSGAALQALFRNPLADPQLIGVSAGAACGGVIGILLDGNDALLVGLALAGGIGALLFVHWLAGGDGGSSGGGDGVLTLVLTGVVVSAVFGALVALAKFVADPQSQLPTMVFWLLGSLAGADYPRLALAAAATAVGLFLLWKLRFPLHVMSLGEDEARAVGLPVRRVRVVAMCGIALITATSVALCGVIGWVGLVVPHLVRMLFGGHFRHFMMLNALLGALYMVGVDTLARSVTDAELPLGALTALAGAPLFAWLLRRMRQGGRAC